MKKTIISIFSLFLGLCAFANIDGPGYYRVQNYGSSRWATLIDNVGSVDVVGGLADLHALELNKDTEEILSDPASIVYVKALGNNRYDFITQGIDLTNLVKNPIYIRKSGTGNGQNLYEIYGSKDGYSKYIADGNLLTKEQYGTASINLNRDRYPNFYKWEFIPMDVNSSNFFGVVPNLNINGKLYCTLYASFPIKPVSPGLKVYYIDKTAGGAGLAEMVEATNGVPSGTPVIIECAGVNASDNKFQITDTSYSISNNFLVGVYFNYFGTGRANRVKFNPGTMRILGKCSDGSLGFITPDIDYIPANTAYLKVSGWFPKELKCVSPDVYTAGVETLNADNEDSIISEGLTVYNPSGSNISVLDLTGKTLLSGNGKIDISCLPKGVYLVVSGKKSLKIMR